MKRVFTKHLGGNATVSTGDLSWTSELLAWTSQENLTIIGAHLAVELVGGSENDGFQKLEMELSFSSTIGMDVAFLSAGSSFYWNTTPAFGAVVAGNQVVMFPEGYGLSMKEGETLFLTAKDVAFPSASVAFFKVNAHIYYVKGSATYK